MKDQINRMYEVWGTDAIEPSIYEAWRATVDQHGNLTLTTLHGNTVAIWAKGHWRLVLEVEL